MQSDPVRQEDTRAWLTKAAKDLRSAENGFSAYPPLLEDVVFHCQQAIEKTLKGFLTWNDIPFRKTHSLEEIGRQCTNIEPAFEEVVDEAAPLTEYAWKFRYPGGVEEPTKEEAEEALKIAHKIQEKVLSSLPPEVHP
jgi:HEPN domain-containing protein